MPVRRGTANPYNKELPQASPSRQALPAEQSSPDRQNRDKQIFSATERTGLARASAETQANALGSKSRTQSFGDCHHEVGNVTAAQCVSSWIASELYAAGSPNRRSAVNTAWQSQQGTSESNTNTATDTDSITNAPGRPPFGLSEPTRSRRTAGAKNTASST